jgi:signal transduction histidine kinase
MRFAVYRQYDQTAGKEMKTSLRVLILEDDKEDFEYITETLERGGFAVTASRVYSREAFTAAMTGFRPDVILSDHALPQFDSTEALIIAKASLPEVPFILVTGAVSDEFAVKTLKLGADDYVLKSNLARLPSAIENALRQKEAELAKARAAQELANRNDELSKINRELDSFVYSVSHNLRAPLLSVLGLTHLARRERNLESLDHYNQLIENSVVKLDETLKGIIEYARNARQEVRRELINFDEILEDNFRKVEFMPGSRNIQKRIAIHSSTPFYSDNYRLSVIFNNLISNAVKYSDPRKPKSCVDVDISWDDDWATIEFRDNGIGIQPELQPKIFDMFFRGTETREGAGLGLYIVHEAVQMLKGRIEVSSTFGEGTCFVVEVPNAVKLFEV